MAVIHGKSLGPLGHGNVSPKHPLTTYNSMSLVTKRRNPRECVGVERSCVRTHENVWVLKGPVCKRTCRGPLNNYS